MSLRTGFVNRASLTSIGTDNYAKTGFGVVDAAMWFSSYPTVIDTVSDNAGMNIGASDGTRQFSDNTSRLNGLGMIDANRSATTAKVVRSLTVGAAILAQASDNGGVTDGRQLNWDDADNAERLTTALLLAADDIHVGSETITGIDIPVDITAPGFEPNAVIFSTTIGSGNTTNAIHSIGFATWDGSTLLQCCYMLSEQDGVTASAPDIIVSTIRCCGAVFGGALIIDYEASDFDSNGFSIIPRTLDSTTILNYVALRLAGNNVWCGVVDTPTSTGNTSHTNPGFRPQFLMQLMSAAESVNTVIAGSSQAGAYGIGMSNTVEGRSFCCTDENAATTSSTSSTVSNRLALLVSHDQGDSVIADLVTMDGSGWTSNYTNLIGASPAVLKWPTLVVGQDSNAGMLQRVFDNDLA